MKSMFVWGFFFFLHKRNENIGGNVLRIMLWCKNH